MDELDKLIAYFTKALAGFQDELLILVGGIVVIMVIWSGIKYMTTDAEAGKKSLTAAIIGLVIIVLSVIIYTTVVGLINTATTDTQDETNPLQFEQPRPSNWQEWLDERDDIYGGG